MDTTRIAVAGSSAAASPRIAPRASRVAAQQRRVEPAAIVSIRSTHNRGWDAAAGGHSVQEASQLDAVPTRALEQVRSVLQRGWDSMRGGHRVQQATYEPTVSNTELTGTIQRWNRNNDGFAGGSKVQAEVRGPRLADRTYGPKARALAETVSAKLIESRPQLNSVQAVGLDRGAVRSILA